MDRLIFHVDINSYFATMLQQENPNLRGKVVGVVKSAGRTCIIASSNEAKRVGIKTGCLLKDARKLALGIIVVPAQFDIMLSATRKLKKMFEDFSPSVDVFSLDEVFLDLTGCEKLFASPTEYAHKIQSRIREVIGEWVQCNVGISHNKLLAKLAGEMAPKGTVFHIDENNLDEILKIAKFRDVCGIGYRLEKRLSVLGAQHPYEINLLDDSTLLEYFGPHWAVELRKIGLGQETHFFTNPARTSWGRGATTEKDLPYQKSVGRTITGYKLCDDEEQIRRVLLNLLEEATHKLRAMDLSGRKIGISLSGHDQYWGDGKTLSYWVRHTDEIWKLLYDGMYRKWDRTFPVIKFGVWIGDCRPTSVIPQSFLPEWERRETKYTMIDKVNDRFGSFTLYPARLLGGPIIKPEVTGYLGDKVYLGL